jgi:NAD(P)-dependent dehydrogenase (short-subunit alcohol dehydrogenase family)
MQTELPMVKAVQADLADWDETRREVEKIGPIDLLVNNAGVMVLQPFLEADKASLDQSMDINFTSVFNVSQVVARAMVKDGRPGVIVNVSSVGSDIAFPGRSVYGESKAAVDMLTRSMEYDTQHPGKRRPPWHDQYGRSKGASGYVESIFTTPTLGKIRRAGGGRQCGVVSPQ